MSFTERLIRFFNKPLTEKRRLLVNKVRLIFTIPFYFGRPFLKNVYITYQPDSYSTFSENEEFNTLFLSFVNKNKLNNGGDIPRLWFFILNIQKIVEEGIKGDFAELGVWRGNTASVLAHYAAKDGRKVYLFDTFEGFDNSDLRGIDSHKTILFNNTSIDTVTDVLGEAKDVCEFIKGYFPNSISEELRGKIFSVVSLDCDLYEPMKAGLDFFYPLMTKGGLLLLHDYSSMHWEGAKKAIDEFCKDTGEFLVLMPDKSGSAIIRKSSDS